MIEVGNALLDAGAATDALQIARRASTMIEAIRSVEATEAAAPKAAVLLARSRKTADEYRGGRDLACHARAAD